MIELFKKSNHGSQVAAPFPSFTSLVAQGWEHELLIERTQVNIVYSSLSEQVL